MDEIFKVGLYLSLIDQFTRPLSEASEKLSDFDAKVRRVSEDLKKFSAHYAQMGMEVMGAGLGMLAAFAGPVKAAMSFQEAMADVQKVANFTAREYQEFSAQILELSRRIPLAAEELTALAAAGAQMGVAKKDLLGFTETVAKLATAFDMPAAQIGDVMGKLANVFKIPISRIGELGDAVNELSNNMAASAPGIIEVLSRIGGTAAQIGLTAQQAAALGASLLALGETPERAATALNDMLNTLATLSVQPRKVREAVEALGLSAEDLEREIREKPIPTLMKFFEVLKQSGDAAKYMNLIFGIEPGPKLVKLIQNTEELQKALGIVGDRARYAGSAQKEFETRSDTLANQLRTLRNTVRSMFISLGNVWIPPLTAFTKMLQKVSAFLADFTQKHRLLAGVLVGVVGAFGVLLTVIGGGLFMLGLFARGVANGLEVLLEMRKALVLLSERWALFWQAIQARGGLLAFLDFQLLRLKYRFFEIVGSIRTAAIATWGWVTAQWASLRAAIAQAGGLRALSMAYLGRLLAGIRTAVAAVWSFNAALWANPLTWVLGPWWPSRRPSGGYTSVLDSLAGP
ncbi:MAG TPA: phage tail tape measure protein [Thermosulfurimonas dismutans]|uniref:Phage tail tape measure protein n=1 Tax=Thermosulfurimonas dismutans TaxID=999894 RepID=A0A7C3GEH9_9BACT|nr:phage tail tape measure protein [Thermosulfurimonas dismutans]